MKHDLFTVAAVIGAFYFGKFRQWRNSRSHRRVSAAVKAVADHLNTSDKKRS